jgi:hypothetical protein
MTDKKSLTYFAVDGNYGNADGLTVVDTTGWDDEIFEMVEESSDQDRPKAARLLSEWIEGGRSQDFDKFFELLGIDIPTS